MKVALQLMGGTGNRDNVNVHCWRGGGVLPHSQQKKQRKVAALKKNSSLAHLHGYVWIHGAAELAAGRGWVGAATKKPEGARQTARPRGVPSGRLQAAFGEQKPSCLELAWRLKENRADPELRLP